MQSNIDACIHPSERTFSRIPCHISVHLYFVGCLSAHTYVPATVSLTVDTTLLQIVNLCNCQLRIRETHKCSSREKGGNHHVNPIATSKSRFAWTLVLEAKSLVELDERVMCEKSDSVRYAAPVYTLDEGPQERRT